MTGPSDVERIRALVCVKQDIHRARVIEVLEDCGDFEIVGQTGVRAEAVRIRRELQPDMMVLDQDLAANDERSLDADFAPIPTILLVDGNAQESDQDRAESRRLRLSRLSKSLLDRDDEFSRSHLMTRVQLVAARCRDRKRTRSARSLGEAVQRVRSRARRAGIRRKVTEITSWPLDLIVLVGGAGTPDVLRSLFPRVRALPVPVLVALSEAANETSAEEDRFGVAPHISVKAVDRSMLIRGASGVLVARGHMQVEVEDAMLRVAKSSKDLDLAQLTRSMEDLGPAGLTVVLSDREQNASSELARVFNAHGLVAVLEPAACPNPEAVEGVLRWGITELALKPDELTWLLGNVLAHRR